MRFNTLSVIARESGRPSNRGAHGVIDACSNAGMGDGAPTNLGEDWIARFRERRQFMVTRRHITSSPSVQMMNLGAYGVKPGNDEVGEPYPAACACAGS
jgi:hypothetical protein